MNPYIPTADAATTCPTPDKDAWEGEQDNGGDGCEGQGR